jgi:hypothetical protein
LADLVVWPDGAAPWADDHGIATTVDRRNRIRAGNDTREHLPLCPGISRFRLNVARQDFRLRVHKSGLRRLVR